LNVKKTRSFVITKQTDEKGLARIVGRGVNRKVILKQEIARPLEI